MTAYEALDAQQEAIAGDVAAWLRSALNPDHPGAPAADRIVNIYMLADIASAINRIADSVEPAGLSLAALEAEYQRGRAEEREAAVKFVRREAEHRYEFDDERNEFAADVVAALAVCIEAGDHLR